MASDLSGEAKCEAVRGRNERLKPQPADSPQQDLVVFLGDSASCQPVRFEGLGPAGLEPATNKL